MERRTLPREPYRGGQICGYQEEYGVVPGRSVFCGDFKALGEYFCQHHHDWLEADGPIRVAPGNVLGLELTFCSNAWQVRDSDGELLSASLNLRMLKRVYGFTLQWEGENGELVDATPEEITAWKLSAW